MYLVIFSFSLLLVFYLIKYNISFFFFFFLFLISTQDMRKYLSILFDLRKENGFRFEQVIGFRSTFISSVVSNVFLVSALNCKQCRLAAHHLKIEKPRPFVNLHVSMLLIIFCLLNSFTLPLLQCSGGSRIKI